MTVRKNLKPKLTMLLKAGWKERNSSCRWMPCRLFWQVKAYLCHELKPKDSCTVKNISIGSTCLELALELKLLKITSKGLLKWFAGLMEEYFFQLLLFCYSHANKHITYMCLFTVMPFLCRININVHSFQYLLCREKCQKSSVHMGLCS